MTNNLTDDITDYVTGEHLLAKSTGGPTRPTNDEISRLAYRLYQARGGQNGRDVEDWLLAERELTEHLD